MRRRWLAIGLAVAMVIVGSTAVAPAGAESPVSPTTITAPTITAPVIDTSNVLIDNVNSRFRFTPSSVATADPYSIDYTALVDGKFWASTMGQCEQPNCWFFAEPDRLSNGPHVLIISATVWANYESYTVQSEPVSFTVSLLDPPPGEPGISINGGAAATNSPDVMLDLVWPSRGADAVLVSNDGGFGKAGATKRLPLAARVPWRLPTIGAERLPRTVYLRYAVGTGWAGEGTFTDDIILDQTVPSIGLSTVVARRATARAAARVFRVRVRAQDASSGVSQVFLSPTKSMRPATKVVLRSKNSLGFFRLDRSLRVRMTKRPVFVKVADAAGNQSPWRRLTR